MKYYSNNLRKGEKVMMKWIRVRYIKNRELDIVNEEDFYIDNKKNINNFLKENNITDVINIEKITTLR